MRMNRAVAGLVAFQAFAACASGAVSGGPPAAPAVAPAAAPAATPPPAAAVVAMPMPVASGPVTTLSGVYSARQATRGEAVFRSSCLECHVPTDYTDDAFASRFVGGTAYDMYEQIRSSMPQENPGSLTNAQYTDLVAYLFQLNRLPTRAIDMPAVVDSLKAIKVEARPPFQHLTQGARKHHGSSHIR
ncbi:MAG: cytochrome c [Gemmatimonadetes bacterium]|nr:cytochrome c [Gemmatimonadota bacterium]